MIEAIRSDRGCSVPDFTDKGGKKMRKKILITGGTGRIATCIAQGLAQTDDYEVFLGTRGEGDGDHLIHLEYHDLEAMTKALTGIEAVIHMGFYMRNDSFIEKHIKDNTVTSYTLYEAARIAGVKRVIFGSSNHIFGYYQKGDHVTSDSLYRPDSPYALAKVFTEMIGRYYSDRYDISCINVRIGNFRQQGNLQPGDIRSSYIWLSNPDCQQLFRKCLEYDGDRKYLQIFGMSANEGCYFDTSDNALIGYEPQSDGGIYREELKGQPGHFFRSGMDSNTLANHNFLGGYSVTIDSSGEIDLDYLEKINREYPSSN